MFYLVRARPKKELLKDLDEMRSSREIARMRPFGEALQYSLDNAKIDDENPEYALWIEEDYCSPPLAMERASVLDRYFSNITTKSVESEEEAWNSLKDKPPLWHRNK
jgi:hypothetical protein